MPRREYGPVIAAAALRVLNHLLEVATRPHQGLADFSPCMLQADLAPIAFPQKDHVSENLMSDVMTCAALYSGQFLKGAALYRSRRYGYWLADKAVQDEMGEVLRRMRSLATKGERTIVEMSASCNGLIAKECATDIRLALDLRIYPVIARLEDMLGR